MTKALGMWQRVPATQYPASRVRQLVAAAKAGEARFYTHGLYSLETLTRPNC